MEHYVQKAWSKPAYVLVNNLEYNSLTFGFEISQGTEPEALFSVVPPPGLLPSLLGSLKVLVGLWMNRGDCSLIVQTFPNLAAPMSS